MRYDKLFTKLFCTPLCLEAGTRAGLERVLLAYMNGHPAEIPGAHEEQPRFFGKKVDPARADRYADGILSVDGPTATIHIDGAIDRNLSAIDRLCFDACDLNDVNRALSRIENDSSIPNILLAINSPGGSVDGIPQTAARIRAMGMGGKKHTKAMIDGLGCSAAYWLASACSEIFATESSLSGSVGVYLALLDQSRFLEDEGLKIETIKDGKLKAAGASWKPLTDDERGHFQAQVAQIGELFRNFVTADRPQVDRSAMEGQSFFGRAALDAGLVDAILPDISAALAQF